MATKFLISRSTRLAFLPLSLIALLAIACGLTPTTAAQPSQTSVAATQAPLPTFQPVPTTLPATTAPLPTSQNPQDTPQVPATGGSMDACKLVTTNEVSRLLGSAPAPNPRPGTNGGTACDFMVDTGLLSIDASTSPQAAAEFQIASQFNRAPGFKSVQSQGISIAVYGGNNVDGNGTPGFTAYMNKDNILVLIKLYSKTYTYNPDQAITLLKTIGGRLP